MQAIKAVSDQALALLDMQRLPPSPANYALAFAYRDGAHPELARAVDVLLEGGVRLKQVEAETLCEQFLGGGATAALTPAAPPGSDRLRHQALRLADLAAAASAVTSEFSRELTGQLPELATAGPAALEHLALLAIARAQHSEQALATTTAELGELRQQLETAQGDAGRDALTGLPNRRGIDAHLAAACRAGGPAVLAICDIDRFKSYNDRYGHAVGDRVLKTVAQSLGETLKGHFVGRWGGEEFLVVLDTRLAEGAALVERAKAELRARHFKLRETDAPLGRITFSAGAVALPDDPAALDAALARADALLYRAKERGRDRVLAD